MKCFCGLWGQLMLPKFLLKNSVAVKPDVYLCVIFQENQVLKNNFWNVLLPTGTAHPTLFGTSNCNLHPVHLSQIFDTTVMRTSLQELVQEFYGFIVAYDEVCIYRVWGVIRCVSRVCEAYDEVCIYSVWGMMKCVSIVCEAYDEVCIYSVWGMMRCVSIVCEAAWFVYL